MSTLALNRTYELRLPQSFVEIDREEMEYVEGGGYVTLIVSTAFQIDAITAGVSLTGGLIGLAIGGAVGSLIGAAGGWIVGGIIARNVTHSQFSKRIYVPVSWVSGTFTL